MNDSYTWERRLGFAVLLPAITLLVLVADLALRPVPLDGLAYRAWEVMTRDPAPGGAFAASRHYETDRAYGDLATLANLPRMRRYRRETFTTDARGFRNPPDLLVAGPPEVVLFGDSFAAGCGVSDNETLAADLAPLTGRRVYDAAGPPVSAEFIRRTLSDLGVTRGVIVWETIEPRRDATQGSAARALTFPPAEWLLWSPIRVLSKAGRKWLENDVILPNASRRLAPALELQGGTTMLFLAEEIDSAVPVTLEEDTVRHIGWNARQIATPDLRVIVLLVPHKFTVYGPLVARSASSSRDAFGKPLAAIERGLRDAGIEVLNVTDALSRAAQQGLATGRLVYHTDDSHWNPAGIRVAARELATVLQGSR